MLVKFIHIDYRKLANPQANCTVVKVCMIVLFILAGNAYVTNSTVFADSSGSLAESNIVIASPGENCKKLIVNDWSKAEKWAWTNICENKRVDFNEHLKENLDPTIPDHDDKWKNEHRTLSAIFLNTILLHEPFRNNIPYRGVRISAAYIQGEFDLIDAVLERPLMLDKSIFSSKVDLRRLVTPTLVNFDGSRFDGELNMDSASIGGSLYMRNSKGSEDVVLRGAEIDRQLAMKGSTFKGELDMNGISVGGSLFMHDGAQFNTVDLRGANIGRQLAMADSTFKGELDMNGISVGGSLFMHDGAQFNTVDLIGAKIGRQLTMNGSAFKGELIMNGISVGDSLHMQDGTQFNTVDLSFAIIDRQLAMADSTFKGKLNMNAISVGGSLYMRDGAQFNTVVLRGAKIQVQLAMNGSTFKDELDMNGISVGGSLHMRDGAQFNTVDLIGAKIGGQLTMNDSSFDDQLMMNGISVGRSLLMRNATYSNNVDLRRAKIGVRLELIGSIFDGELDMDSTLIGSSLIISNTEFKNMTNLTFLSVGSNLEIQGGVLRRLDLTGTRIERTLKLSGTGKSNLKWKNIECEDNTSQSPKMTLRNAKVDVLEDTDNFWPNHFELEGFTYNHLARSGLYGQKTSLQRDSDSFKRWLEADKTYSPQPYTQLARVLRTAGLEDMAEEIQYASRDRMLSESSLSLFKFLFLWALKLFIGFGIGEKNFFALLWMAGLVALGTLILINSKERDRPSTLLDSRVDCFIYSLDMIIPLIHLREQHYESVDLVTRAKYYFYIHKIMGYILVLFVIAGLSGLTE